MNQNAIVNTQYDTSAGHYATYIQQRLQQTTAFIEQQLSELTGMLQSRGMPHGPTSTTLPNQSKSAILSIVPATNESQSATLLFTQETQNTFLRAALGRDLFFRLKKIAKRWYANVEESERRHATRISQDVAKAVTDGRVSNITEKHLEAYRTRIQQTYQVPYHIPTEELRKAFSRKIRVYLQNTKTKHQKWIDEYKGAIDIKANLITIEQTGRDDNDPSVKDEESDEEKETQHIAKKLKKENTDDDISAYSAHSNHQTHARHQTETQSAANLEEFYEFYCVVPGSYFTESGSPKSVDQAGSITDSSRRSLFHFLQQQFMTVPYPSELLAQPHILYICYCIQAIVGDRPIGVLCDNLVVTAVRLMAACFAGNENQGPRALNPIQCSIEIRKASYFESDPDPKDEIFTEIISKREFHSSPEYIPVALFAAFVDYAIYMNIVSREEWKNVLPEINHPFTLISNCLTELGLSSFPHGYSRREVGNFILLFMFCFIEKARGVQVRSVSASTLFVQNIFNGLCEVVLEDIVHPASTDLLDRTPATYYTYLKNWTTN